MEPIKYNPFHAVMQKIASTRPGAWFYSRTLHHFDRIVLKLSGGRATMTSVVAGLPLVLLTTTGAKSGLPRTLPLISITDEQQPDALAVIASNWGQAHYPAWYHNLKKNPHATCSMSGQTSEYLAHEASGEEYERFWQIATQTYLGYPLYKQRASHRRIPIMVLTQVKT